MSMILSENRCKFNALFAAISPETAMAEHFSSAWKPRTLAAQALGAGEPITHAVVGVVRAQKTKLVWIETPANPLWNVTDIAAVAAIAHGAGAQVVVDSTVATPVFTRPLSLGADIVMHSATKYLNGHSDVVAGA